MPPFFFITMREEAEAVAALCLGLLRLSADRRLVLLDRDKEFMAARLDLPGSLYESLQTLQPREISYAEMAHSYAPVPGTNHDLEFQRFEFDRKGDAEIASAGEPEIPASIKSAVYAELRKFTPSPPAREREKLLSLLWLNNEDYVRDSPPRRVARILWLFHQGRNHAGIYLDAENEDGDAADTRAGPSPSEPLQKDYLTQVMEVSNCLNLAPRLHLTISTGSIPLFSHLYVKRRDGGFLEKESELFRGLRRELYNTQILATESLTYKEFVLNRLMTGEEASLVNAFIGFCHTNLAHNQPHRYTLEDVMRAFHSHPDVALKLTALELR
jgi:glutamate dehydrogenase